MYSNWFVWNYLFHRIIRSHKVSIASIYHKIFSIDWAVRALFFTRYHSKGFGHKSSRTSDWRYVRSALNFGTYSLTNSNEWFEFFIRSIIGCVRIGYALWLLYNISSYCKILDWKTLKNLSINESICFEYFILLMWSHFRIQ